MSQLAGSHDAPFPDGLVARPVILHLCHNWGGGTLRWIEDFVRGEKHWRHLLIRMVQRRDVLGSHLELVDPSIGMVLMSWELAQPIVTTATSNTGYAQILRNIVDTFGVGLVVISSLIGHSLDIFRIGRPTIVVLHDFYPFCPAMFAWFGKPCESCGPSQLEHCLAENPHNVLWGICDPEHQFDLREAYAQCLAGDNVKIVAPSRSLHARYAKLLPVLYEKPWHFIPHGIDPDLFISTRLPPVRPADGGSRRLRVVLPGRLSPHKGLALLGELVGEIADFVDLLLLGSGDFGRAFAHLPHVRLVCNFESAELREHIEAFDPDCALLLSVVPESFSFTLSEMWALGLPVVATRQGAFAERIQDGETGFLVDGEADHVALCLRRLASERALLQDVADKVRRLPVRTTDAMVSEYERLFPEHSLGDRADPISLGLWQCVLRLKTDDVVRDRMNSACGFQPGEALNPDGCGALEVGRAGETRNAVVDSLKQQLADERARIAAMRGSTSWRITRPVRAVKRLLTSLKAVSVSDGSRSEHAKSDFPEGERRVHGNGNIDDRPVVADVVAPRGDFIVERLAAKIADQLGLSLGNACETSGASVTLRSVDAMDRDVVSSSERIDAFSDLLHPGRIHDLPLVGEWERLLPRRREFIEQARQALFLPDSARLVVGSGRMDSNDGLLEFARVAMAIGKRENRHFFVWLGRRDEAWLGEHYGEIGLAITLGVLRLVEDADFEAWFLASDVYLGCRQQGQYDPGAIEAAAAGLPVVLAHESGLPRRDQPSEVAQGERDHVLCDRVRTAATMPRTGDTDACGR